VTGPGRSCLLIEASTRKVDLR